jgi:hypothetical protein
MRKNERFASGQPRHWDLVSEVRDRPSTSGRIRFGVSYIAVLFLSFAWEKGVSGRETLWKRT